jgi:hypothetical protein
MPTADGGLGTALVGEKIVVNSRSVAVTRLLGEGKALLHWKAVVAFIAHWSGPLVGTRLCSLYRWIFLCVSSKGTFRHCFGTIHA